MGYPNWKATYHVELPGGDRIYIWNEMPPELYEHFRKQGGTILKVNTPVDSRTNFDAEYHVSPYKEEIIELDEHYVFDSKTMRVKKR